MANADMRPPTGDQLQRLREAILAAYDYGSLTRMVHLQLDNQLLHLVPFVDKNLVDMVDALVATYASKPGGLHELVTAATAGNPTNSGLRAIVEELLAIDFAPLPAPKPSTPGQITANIGAGASVVAIGTDIIQEVHNYYYAPSKPQAVDPATVKAAEARLVKLPLDHVPPVANALPPGSRMELGANHLFVGRDKELKKLAASFSGPWL